MRVVQGDGIVPIASKAMFQQIFFEDWDEIVC